MTNPTNESEYQSSLNERSLLVFFSAIALGLFAAVLILPSWLPGLATSLAGTDPKAFWYLSRATAFVAMGMLWASMMLGVGITNKAARLWPGAPAAFALHEYFSLLGLAFAAFHGLILLGDHYSQYTLVQLLVPFAAGQYHPFWVGLGQLGFYAWAIITGSFYVRKSIGQKTWRVLHAPPRPDRGDGYWPRLGAGFLLDHRRQFPVPVHLPGGQQPGRKNREDAEKPRRVNQTRSHDFPFHENPWEGFFVFHRII
jgi:hypothetical protein